MFWHYHLCKTDINYGYLYNGVLPQGNRMSVTQSGLQMTVSDGYAVAYGRHAQIVTPVVLEVGTTEVGWVVIDYDLNATNTMQVKVKTTTEEPIQQDLIEGGLQFQQVLGTYDSTSGSVEFTRTAIELSNLSFNYFLDDQFVTLDTSQDVSGGKNFTSNMTTLDIRTHGGYGDGGTTIAESRVSIGGDLWVDGDDTRLGKVTAGNITSGSVTSSGSIKAKTAMRVTGATFGENDGAYRADTDTQNVNQGGRYLDWYYSDGKRAWSIYKSGSSNDDARAIVVASYKHDGDNVVDSGIRITAEYSKTGGVKHQSAEGGIHRLAYIAEPTTMMLEMLNLQKTNIQLDIANLEVQLQVNETRPTVYHSTRNIITNKQMLLTQIEERIAHYQSELNKEGAL